MTINIQNLVQALEQKQNSLSSPLDIMQMSKAIDLLRLNKVNFIEKFSLLPDVSTVALGTLYYVENEQSLYIVEYDVFAGKRWRSLSENYGITLSWARNNLGALGDGTTTNKSSPISVVGGFTDWCQVGVGESFGAGVRSNGTLWAWGCNSDGQLGDNTTVNKSSPVSVVGGFTDWCQVSAGTRHTAAVRTNGTLWAWGSNNKGQFGDGTNTRNSSPVSVVGGFTDWCQVSAGNDFTSAIRTNGTLWTWGDNSAGLLGDGTTTNKSSPVSVVGGFTNWCQVSSGLRAIAAVRSGGTLWAWGCNSDGQLGDNTIVDKSSPVLVVGGFTDWCQAASGDRFMVGLRQNGTLWSWGTNGSGRLGDNNNADRSSPVSVVGGFTDWCYVVAGDANAGAIRTNGTLWMWGRGEYGKLGNNNTTDRSSPISVLGGFTNWCSISLSSATKSPSIGLLSKTKKF